MAGRALLQALTESQPDYSEALHLLRHQDLRNSERRTRLQAKHSSRCTVCTLPLPCAHSPVQPGHYKVRYRSATSVSFACIQKRSQSLSVGRESGQHRRLLVRLRQYQAEKCAKEISRIEAFTRQQEVERVQALEREEKRVQRAENLKARLLAYESVKIEMQREKQEATLQTLRKQRESDRKRRRYLRKQVKSTLETASRAVPAEQPTARSLATQPNRRLRAVDRTV